MRILAIIQARMASTRLPGKVLVDIAGQPLLARVVQRVLTVPEIDEIVIATTDTDNDDELAFWIKKNTELACYRGSEMDVLDRFYQCSKIFQSDLIVRITADDPLKDPGIITKAIKYFNSIKDLDYCSNTIYPTYPEGLDVEVFRYSALEKAWNESNLLSEREHVTPYIWKNKERFNTYNFEYERDLSDWRWTVDKPDDLAFMNRVFEHFVNNPIVGYEDVIEYLENNPEVIKINSKTVRNEGYLKSLNAEVIINKKL